MSAISTYIKFLRKKKAAEKILADLKKSVLRELRKCPDGKFVSNLVEFHLTNKRTASFAEDVEEILKNLRNQIDEQKKRAIDAGQVSYEEEESFDAEIPKTDQKKFLAEDRDYRRHFGIH
jgi:hypothetical protein